MPFIAPADSLLKILIPILLLSRGAWAEEPACKYRPVPFDRQEAAFCLEFAADYYYRLRQPEEHVFRYGQQAQTVQRQAISSRGALFMLGMSRAEAGWASGQARASHNYWGLGGAFKRADGTSTFMTFRSFDQAIAYLANHLDRGISPRAFDSINHPGWPEFLPLMAEENFTNDQVNSALNSGQWCSRFPAYNIDLLDKSCKGRNCGCIDYAGLIDRLSIAHVVSKCTAVFRQFPDKIVKSLVYASESEAPLSQLERRRIAARDFEAFADERCRTQ